MRMLFKIYPQNFTGKFYQTLKEQEIPRRMASARWWNRSFLPSFSQRTLILAITHRCEYLCGTQELQRSSAHHWEDKKKLRLGTLKRVSRTVSLFLCHPIAKVAQLSAERWTQPAVSPSGESESIWVSFLLPQLWRTLSKTPTSFSLVQNTGVIYVTAGQGETGSIIGSVQNSTRNTGLTNHTLH